MSAEPLYFIGSPTEVEIEADVRLASSRPRFVEFLGADHPDLDLGLQSAASAYFGFRHMAEIAGELKKSEAKLRADRATLEAAIKIAPEAGELLQARIEAIDQGLQDIAGLKSPHRKPGSGNAVPRMAIVFLWGAYKVTTGHDPREDGTGKNAPFIEFVELFLDTIGAEQRAPDDLVRDCRRALNWQP